MAWKPIPCNWALMRVGPPHMDPGKGTHLPKIWSLSPTFFLRMNLPMVDRACCRRGACVCGEGGKGRVGLGSAVFLCACSMHALPHREGLGLGLLLHLGTDLILLLLADRAAPVWHAGSSQSLPRQEMSCIGACSRRMHLIPESAGRLGHSRQDGGIGDLGHARGLQEVPPVANGDGLNLALLHHIPAAMQADW
jgi:hypothetical protein